MLIIIGSFSSKYIWAELKFNCYKYPFYLIYVGGGVAIYQVILNILFLLHDQLPVFSPC